MEKGLLVPDELVIDMLMARLQELNAEQGFILDGFPRTLVQARALDAALAKAGKSIDITVNISGPDNVLMERMLGRAKESGRSDDTPEAMRTRLEKMKPPADLLAHYDSADKLREVDGTPPVETVTAAVLGALGIDVAGKAGA
jgi:adenylate kinase